VNRDIIDALEHVSGMVGRDLHPSDFSFESFASYAIDDIPDDLFSWAEWGWGDFRGLSTAEIYEELESFRGEGFARLAAGWLRSGVFPPVVVVITRDGFAEVGDGRGRISVAIAANISHIPAVFAREQ